MNKPAACAAVTFLSAMKDPSFHYYIEVTDKAVGTHRTADYTVAVVDGAGACKGRVMAGALTGAMTASGSNGTYSGTFDFGTSRGQILITRFGT